MNGGRLEAEQRHAQKAALPSRTAATHTEAEEIVAEANDFLALVQRWIAAESS